MGSVTHPSRARGHGRDGADPLRRGLPRVEHGDRLSLANANSPMVWDSTMLGAAKAYAEANQAVLITPFILAGAMSPATVVGDRARRRSPSRSPGWRSASSCGPGAPVDPRLVRLVDVDAVGRADVRHAGAGADPLRDGGARAAARRPVPLGRRADGVEDRRRAGGLRVGEHDAADDARRRQLRPPRGRLARGRARDGLREVHPRRRPGRRRGTRSRRASTCPRTARRSTRSSRTSRARTSSATRTRSRTSRRAFYRSSNADNGSFEQWELEGAQDANVRANATWKKMLAEYEAPPIDDAVDEELREWIERKKASFPDSNA